MLGVVLAGVFSGLALGMLGAGGTIIGLPMLLYIGGPQGHVAFGTNAFGVAVIACLLLLWRAARREINFVLGIAFAIPGLFGIAIGVRLGLLFPAGKLVFLLSFLILVVAGWIGYLSTGPGDPAKTADDPRPVSSISTRQIVRIAPTAFAVGVISGFFAIGGGFLVVPGLALAAAIDLRLSARCSLIPIAAFAALDALEYVHAGNVQFGASGFMIAAGIVGGAGGLVLSNRLPLRTIQRAFAVFLGVIAVYMVVQNI